MTADEFQTIFYYLVSEGEAALPYGMMPGSTPGGLAEITTEEAWNDYGWNPPQYMAHLPEYSTPDPMATPKLTWSDLVGHLDAAMTDQLRPTRLLELRRENRRRIIAVYGETTFEGEVMKRLRDGETQNQRVAREAHLTRYRTIKNLIEDLNYADLQAFDVTEERLWQDLP